MKPIRSMPAKRALSVHPLSRRWGLRWLGRILLMLGAGVPAWGALPASAAKTVDIWLKPLPARSDGPAPTHLVLSQDYSGFHCHTDQVPNHRITVKGLQSLESPVKAETISPDCKTALVWGKAKSCYVAHREPVVDDVIQWCLNI
jgi:hypothetical protein